MSTATGKTGAERKDAWLTELRTGCTVLRFHPQSIPEGILRSILEAGCQTAAPMNLQPWQFIVLRSQAGRARLLRHCAAAGPASGAPVLLVGLGDPRAWKRAPARLDALMRSGSLAPNEEASHLDRIQRQWSSGDTGRVFAIAHTHTAMQQICLAALAFDVCSWWVPEYDAAGIARALHIPESLLVVGVLGLGYCAERAQLPAPSLPRTVFAEAYGLAWPGLGEEQE